MTKLISGRVSKIPSANVRADRYQFLEVSEAEPDLGLPSELGQVFTSDLSGNRRWTRLDTANVSEGATNLYYTNERVMANVAVMSVGVFYDVSLANVSTGKALVWDDAANGFIPVYVNSEVANVADLSKKVLDLSNQTTANVREHYSNLYFTNTRVLDAISLATINPDNVNAKIIITDSITSNTWNNLYTANIVELNNLFYTNSRVVSAVVPLLTTANVIESQSNLYFTNARVIDAISLANINPNHVTINGNLVVVGYTIANDIVADDVRSNVATFGYATVGQLTVNSNLTVYGDFTTYGANNAVISDNMLYLNHGTNTAANPDLGIVWAFNPDGAEPYQHGGIFRDATDGVIKFFQHYTLEPDSNAFLDLDTGTSGFEFANIQATTFLGNVIGVVSSLSNHTTDSLAEGSRQYFTNVRVLQAVNPLLTTANVSELNNQYFTNVRVLQAVNPLLTTANVLELTNLYFTNARVLSNVEQMSINVLADVDISGVGVGGVLVWDGTKFVPGSTDVTLRANFANTAGAANVSLLADASNIALSLSNHTTANLAEGTNLYFTNVRAIGAFTAGRGIVIQESGLIKSTIGTESFNTELNGSKDYNITSSLATALQFPSTPSTSRYLLRSLHITNISNSTTFVTANVAYNSGNSGYLGQMISVPEGGIVEFINKPQVMQPGDKINLQGFDSSQAATSGLLQASMAYESINDDITYVGNGQTLATSNTDIQLLHADQSTVILESIKFVNLKNYTIPVKTFWGYANGTPKSYFAYNMQIPPNSSVEILQRPKVIDAGDKVFGRYTNASNGDAVSVFVSYRNSSVTTLLTTTSSVQIAGNVGAEFSTTVSDGTILYYTLEE